MDKERIIRLAQRGVQSNKLDDKHNSLWEILREFNITPEDISTAKPPTYYKDKD